MIKTKKYFCKKIKNKEMKKYGSEDLTWLRW